MGTRLTPALVGRSARPLWGVGVVGLLALIGADALTPPGVLPAVGATHREASADTGTGALGRASLGLLPHASVLVQPRLREMTIELPPVDLPARTPSREIPMVLLPVFQAEIPVSGSLYSYRVELVDNAGRLVPKVLLHHFNLTDPDHRELFLPIALHLLAASKETPDAQIPWLLFGMPLERGQRLITSAMLDNPTAVPYHGVRVRLVLRYTPAGRPWPLFRAYPWAMDVAFPLGRPPRGSKAFDLAPGRTVRSWESSPAVPGTILGMGGHLHDYGQSLELRDVTTGEVIWHAAPVTDSAGQTVSLPVVRFYRWNRLGVHIVPEHRYRLTAVYENPTGQTLADGGMGAVAGLFIPDPGTTWPPVDTTDALYQQDLHGTLWRGEVGDILMVGGHH